MSNGPRRRRRVIGARDLFPQSSSPDILERLLSHQIRTAKHEANYEELGPRMGEVHCTCGYVQAYFFGGEHAEKIIENHYAMFRIIHDPRGAKYRKGQ